MRKCAVTSRKRLLPAALTRDPALAHPAAALTSRTLHVRPSVHLPHRSHRCRSSTLGTPGAGTTVPTDRGPPRRNRFSPNSRRAHPSADRHQGQRPRGNRKSESPACQPTHVLDRILVLRSYIFLCTRSLIKLSAEGGWPRRSSGHAATLQQLAEAGPRIARHAEECLPR